MHEQKRGDNQIKETEFVEQSKYHAARQAKPGG